MDDGGENQDGVVITSSVKRNDGDRPGLLILYTCFVLVHLKMKSIQWSFKLLRPKPRDRLRINGIVLSMGVSMVKQHSV